jgi:hypothetical protein
MDQHHVVERFKLAADGMTVDISIFVDDPGAFNDAMISVAPGRHDSVVDGRMQRGQRRFLQSGTSACTRGRRVGFLIARFLFDGPGLLEGDRTVSRTDRRVGKLAGFTLPREPVVLMSAQQMDSTFLVMQYVR